MQTGIGKPICKKKGFVMKKNNKNKSWNLINFSSLGPSGEDVRAENLRQHEGTDSLFDTCNKQGVSLEPPPHTSIWSTR